MSNLELLSAGFSTILSTEVAPQKNGENFSIHDLFSQTYVMRPPVPSSVAAPGEFDINIFHLRGKTFTIRVTEKVTVSDMKAEIENKVRINADQIRLIYGDRKLQDDQTVKDYGTQPNETIHLVLYMAGAGAPLPRAFNTDELDSTFDYDFTNAKDDSVTYMRGGFEYKRPYRWKRITTKVVGRYGNDDWLGPNGIRRDQERGEWPVSYHGTNMGSAKMILKEG